MRPARSDGDALLTVRVELLERRLGARSSSWRGASASSRPSGGARRHVAQNHVSHLAPGPA